MIGARGAVAAAFVAIAFGATACSALLSWDGFTGGSDDGGASVDGGAHDGASGDATPTTCSGPSQCMTTPPSGWSGPVALFEAPASQGAPAPCGAGFDATPIFDGKADPTAPPASCTACGCGAPSGTTCTGPELTFFSEQSCATPCGTPVVLSATCTIAGPTCRGVVVGAPKPSGGSCAASGGAASVAPFTWGKIGRACAPSVTPHASGCSQGQVCAPPPAPPYGAHACILQAGAAASCPAEYPVGPHVYYADATDTRGCSPCACAAPNGGRCSVASPAGHAFIGFPCIQGSGNFDAPSACAPWVQGSSVTIASTPTLDDAGACAPSGGSATGSAIPTHPTSFCCAL